MEASRVEKSAAFSVEFLIWSMQHATGKRVPQAMFYEALCGLDGMGALEAEEWEYHADESAGTPPARLQRRARTWSRRWEPYWIRRWDTTTPLSEDAFGKMISHLDSGRTLAAGLRWPKQFRGHELDAVLPPNEVFDGHSVLLVGYGLDQDLPGNGYFLFRNTAGSGWGEGGYGRMSFAYARAYLNDVLGLTCRPNGYWDPTRSEEFEDLQADPGPGRLTPITQDMSGWLGRLWGGEAHAFVGATRPGDGVAYSLESPGRGKYRVALFATAARDFGVIQVRWNGEVITTVDLYAGRVSPTGRIPLGEIELGAGKQDLEFVVIDKAEASSGYCFGLDRLDLVKVEK